MRTPNHLAIVFFSFALSDVLSTEPIERVRWGALVRGKRRLARVRAAGRRVQDVIDRVGLAVANFFAWNRDKLAGGCGYVYCRTRDGVVSVHHAVADRVERVVGRMAQVFRVIGMFAAMYSLLVRPMSRKLKVVGLRSEETPMPASEVPAVVEAPAPLLTAPALVQSLPMPSAARVTTEPAADEKADLVERAKAMISGGKSRRATAKELNIPESTLRTWLRK